MSAVSYFVTGTDTGVGKTLVSCALLHALAARHPNVVGMKPVAAGAQPTREGKPLNDDVLALRTAGTLLAPAELDNPYCFPDPISPHLAARRQNQVIDLELIRQCHIKLAGMADAVVVEGAGGFHVPLTDTLTGADLAVALGLPVILVVGLRLGCLSHTLLTQEAIVARGLTLAGWVANRVDSQMLAPEDNLATLKKWIRAPLLGDVAHMEHPQPSLVKLKLP